MLMRADGPHRLLAVTGVFHARTEVRAEDADPYELIWTVAQRLWTNAPLRAALIQQAQRLAPPSANDRQAVESALNNVESGLATISGLSLPIGWGKAVRPDRWYVAASGWLLTAIAVSLGAPFWFDLLGKVAQLRTTGARPGTNPSPPVTAPGAPPATTASTG